MSSLRRWRDDVQTILALDNVTKTADDQPLHLPPPVLEPTPKRGVVARVRSHVRHLIARPPGEMPAALGLQFRRHESIKRAPSPLDRHVKERKLDLDAGQVDEVVVDRSSWSDSSSVKSDVHSGLSSYMEQEQLSETELKQTPTSRFWSCCRPLRLLRWRLWPATVDFFHTSFRDRDIEERYQKEVWAQSKRPSLWACIFFIINWLLGVVFIPLPTVLADQVFYYGVATFLTFPLIFFNLYDIPRCYPIFYQIFLAVFTYSWSTYQVIYVFLCTDYSSKTSITCAQRDFLPTFYYTSALLAVALFGAHMKRLSAAVASLIFLVLSTALITPVQASWTRNIVNTIVYDVVLLYMHYKHEESRRRVFSLQIELNQQFQHTQAAMSDAQKAAESKRRLTSYVFHEVRVPLNVCLIAMQNIEASGVVMNKQEVEFNALRGSLSMMSKVLNDVLDFNRMDSGNFESVSKPYAFHSTMASLFLPLKLATNARNLKFETDLDPEIDNVARRARHEALGEDPPSIDQLLRDNPSSDSNRGIVVGDETRLRQIVTNLASNACKFTPSGGKLLIKTKLVYPTPSLLHDAGKRKVSTSEPSTALSEELLNRHDLAVTTGPVDKVVVRIEVSDTGSGLRPADVSQGKLFSAFNQTEQGRLQGGKGTGLGLALVRQIVKNSHGKLGVRSKVGEGSTFWVELPLGVGQAALDYCGPTVLDNAASPKLNAEEFFEDPADATEVIDAMNGAAHGEEQSLTPVVDSGPQRFPVRHRPGRLASGNTSASALHRLMDQGGQVELTLSGYESHSPVPTRTLGDSSTGTEFDLNSPTTPTQPFHSVPPTPSDGHPFPPETELTMQAGLPVSVSAADSPLASVVSTASESAHEHRVLVVDDDSLTRTLMKRMLTRLGYKVSTADNGAKALAMILGVSESAVVEDELETTVYGEGSYSIIFMDNQMPVLSGLAAAQKLRALGRRDFVVGVTGNALLADQQEYLDAGADHVLIKPVLERSLKHMLALAEERRKLS